MKAAIILAAALLAGCSTFKLGAMMYCPYGQNCEMAVSAPAAPASGVQP